MRVAAARLLFAAAVVGAFLVVGVSALPSCAALPGKTCFGDRVNVFEEQEDAGPSSGCTSCLQERCCDRVGECSEDPACVDQIRATHSCVIDGGPSVASACKASLRGGAKSQALHACMRQSCGRTCGVPSCDLDPAVVLLAEPACDRCLGGACCEKVNACYKSRGCKLVVECITRHCPRTLGPALSGLGSEGPQAIREQLDAVCTGEAPAGAGPGPCLQKCLDDFAPLGDGRTPDDLEARCLAFGVYTCGASAGCGSACTSPEAGAYARDESWEAYDDPALLLPGE